MNMERLGWAGAVLIAVFVVAGCGKGEEGGTEIITNPIPTASVTGNLNPSEVGGNDLTIYSAHQDPAPITGSQFSTTTSTAGTQLLLIVDGQNSLRGLTLSILPSARSSPSIARSAPEDPIPSIIPVGGDSTALSLLMLTPGILTVDPSETTLRIQELRQLPSFPVLVNYLKGGLPGKPLAELIQEESLQNILVQCITEWLEQHPFQQKILHNLTASKAFFDVSVKDQSDISHASVELSNRGWRYVNVFRRDLNSFGGEIAVSPRLMTTKGPCYMVSGAKPVSWGSVFTRTTGAPTLLTDTVDFSSVATSEYWVIGPGFGVGDSPPPTIDTAIPIDVWGCTFVGYLAAPILDIVIGAGDFLTKSFETANAIWDIVKFSIDLGSLAKVNSLKSAASTLVDIIGEIVGSVNSWVVVEVSKGTITPSAAARLKGVLGYVNLSMSVANGIVAAKYLYETPSVANVGPITVSQFILTATKSGSGGGGISLDPPGINCLSDCNQTYPIGTNVTLTASANIGSVFGGWSGCTSVSGTTCNVTMDSDKIMAATFNTVAPSPIDSTPPDTLIDSGPPASTTSTSATFTFHSTENGSTFECKLDTRSFTACINPQTYSGLTVGSHTFSVKAIDAAGNIDQSPDSYSWTIVGNSTTLPVISNLNPAIGSIGTTVIIAGSDFGSSQVSSTVKFNGISAQCSSWTDMSITCFVPSGATTGNVVVTTSAGPSNGVHFTVTDSPCPIVSPTSLSFTAVQGSNPPSQSLTITNSCGGSLNWGASDDAIWLDVTPLNGLTPGTLTISVNTGGLQVRQHTGSVFVDAGGNLLTVPVTLTVCSSGTACPTILAGGLHDSLAVSVDGTDVYFTEHAGNTVKKISINTNNGSPTVLASGLNGPWLIAIDGSNVYWTEGETGGTVKKISKTAVNGTPTILASGIHDPLGIAVDGANVYFTEYADNISGAGAIKRVPINGGTTITLASGLTGPRRIAIDADNVYWTELGGNAVKKIAKTAVNGTPTVLAGSLNGPRGIAVDSNSVYFTEYAGAITGQGTIKKVPITGGAPTPLASNLHGPRELVIDNANLYFTEVADSKMGTGALKSVPLGGGGLTLLASGLNDPAFPAVDSNSVYWTEQGTAERTFHDGLVKKVKIPQILPDLVVTTLNAPSTGTIGGNISVSLVVENQGNASTGAFQAAFYYSTDSVIGTNDIFSGFSCESPGLAVGGSLTCNGSIGVHSSLASGSYFLGGIADSTQVVTESNEANNTRSVGPITLASSPAPSAPSGMQAVGSSNTILLMWNDNSSNETGFRIERKTGVSGSFSEITTVGAGVTAFEDTGRTFGFVYCYRVLAFNASGSSDYTGEDCGTALATPVLSSPAAGANITTNSVNLQWNDVTAATGYSVDVGTSCGGTTILNGQVTSSANITISSLSNGTYFWRVKAFNGIHSGLSAISPCRSFQIAVNSSSLPIPLKITAAGLNVRTGPDTTSSIVTTGSLNQEFVAFEKSGTWYRIYLPDLNGPSTGWINSFAASTGTTLAVEDPLAQQVQVLAAASLGLNVRSGAGTSFSILTKIWPGQRFVTVGTPSTGAGCTSSWIQIYLTENAGAQKGWSCGDFLTTP